MKALIIDDSRAIRSIVGKIMREAGYEVLEAPDGRAALDTLRKSSGIRVVLVDWNMPEMNGVDFVRAMRAAPEWATIKIMMITSENDLERVRQALDAGAEEYIMKPFTADMVAAKLILLGLPAPKPSEPAPLA